ncbi:MAG: hypothetical protein WBF51_02155 [Candidatus Dormiibacterota bacterium]
MDGYEVDSAWVTGFFLDLRSRGRSALVQVHTHPRSAFHSEVDDVYALAPSTGFYSLVLPNFATGPVTLTGSCLLLMGPDGTWTEVNPAEEFVVQP